VKRQRRSVRSEIPGLQFYPAKNMTIQLYEQDTFNWDDLLGSATTDSTGHFDITGKQNELGYLRPYLYITHTCPSIFREYEGCTFITRIDIPHKVVNSNHELELPLGSSFNKVICS